MYWPSFKKPLIDKLARLIVKLIIEVEEIAIWNNWFNVIWIVSSQRQKILQINSYVLPEKAKEGRRSNSIQVWLKYLKNGVL